MATLNLEKIRIEKVNQAMNRIDKGRVINGANLSADEIYLALTEHPAILSFKLTWLSIRSSVRNLRRARTSRS